MEIEIPSIGRMVAPKMKVPATSVKSAARVLQILEYFDAIRRTANVVEVCRYLEFPQSSTSALLRTLVDMGYLKYNRSDRTYVLTSRVSLMGHWVNQHLFDRDQLLHTMQDLAHKTGDAIILGARNELQVQYIHIIQSTSPARLHVTPGAVRPLVQSGIGYAILSQYSDAEALGLLNRHNAGVPPEKRVKRELMLSALDEARKQGGCAFALNTFVRGGGVLAMPLPTEPGQPPLALGIGGISEVMAVRRQELIDTLRSAVKALLEPPANGGREPLHKT